MDTPLLSYYEAIERASLDMLRAAQRGDWAQVAHIEGTCGELISQLDRAKGACALAPEQARARTRILRRILLNDAQIRALAEPWHADLDALLAGRPRTLH